MARPFLSSMSNALNSSESLIGQAEVLNRLEQILCEGRAQSILFLGPRGSGRHSLARAAAKALLCEEPHTALRACDHCPSCRYFEAQAHPDFKEIDQGEDKVIKVERLRREVLADLPMKPQISRVKVTLIDGDVLNEQGQNALLKSLEEPPAGTIFFLTGERSDVFLPTILSRSVLISPRLLTPEEIRELLHSRGFEEENEIALSFSAGIPGRALELAGDERVAALREQAVMVLTSCPELNPLQSMEKIQPLLSESKEHWLLFLDFLQSALRDLALLLAESDTKVSFRLLNEDKRGELRAFLQKMPQDCPVRRLDAAMQGLISLRKAEAAHVNFELASWQLQLLLTECFEAKGEKYGKSHRSATPRAGESLVF